MLNESSKSQQTFVIIGAILAWFAVIFQLYLIIINRNFSVLITIFRFFSFFTILTNIIVAITFSSFCFQKNSVSKNFFSQSKVLTAVTVYITIVGLVYNLILRFTWQPKGLQMLVDELLHTVIPIYFIIFWLIFVPKGSLGWKNVFPWLLYPFMYLVYIMIWGHFSTQYPYPFINVMELGYERVLINSVLLFITFLIMSFLFVGIGKLMNFNSKKINE